MQKNKNQSDATKFNELPSKNFFEENNNENNQNQKAHKSTDSDSPNREHEIKNPQKILNNEHTRKRCKENKNWSMSMPDEKQSKNHNKDDTNYNEKPFQMQKCSEIIMGRKEKIKLTTPNFVKAIQKQTNFPAVYVILTILACGIFVYFGFFEVFLTNLIGIIFPIYWSMRALDIDINSKDEEKQWYTYWLMFLSMLPIDMLLGQLLRYIPFFYLIKYIFLCWLFLPNFYGASYIHDLVIRKNLPQFEIVYRIDNASDSIQKHFRNFPTRLHHKRLESTVNESRESLRKQKSKALFEKRNFLKKSNISNRKKAKVHQRERIRVEIEENRRPETTKDKAEDESETETKQNEIQEEEFKSQSAYERENQQNKNNSSRNNNIKIENNKGRIKNKNQSKFAPLLENKEEKRPIKSERNQKQKKIKKEENKQKMSEAAGNELEQTNKMETSNGSKFFESSEAEKSDVSDAYDNLISHFKDIKSCSGITKDLIKSTIKKIWSRLKDESVIHKSTQEKDLFDKTDKMRFEEHIREKYSANSDKFEPIINKGSLDEEQQTRNLLEKNSIENKENIDTSNIKDNKIKD